MSYESPISVIVNNMISDIRKQQENQVIEAVVSSHVSVDKEELIKALAYDRDQYAKGYQDCMELYGKALEIACEDIRDDRLLCPFNVFKSYAFVICDRFNCTNDYVSCWKEWFLYQARKIESDKKVSE